MSNLLTCSDTWLHLRKCSVGSWIIDALFTQYRAEETENTKWTWSWAGEGYGWFWDLNFPLAAARIITWIISVIQRGETTPWCVSFFLAVSGWWGDDSRRVQVTRCVARHRWEFPPNVSYDHRGDTRPSFSFDLQPNTSIPALLTRRVCVCVCVLVNSHWCTPHSHPCTPTSAWALVLENLHWYSPPRSPEAGAECIYTLHSVSP